MAIEDKEMEEGTFVRQYGVYALTKAVGKPDHRVRVKVVGLGIEKWFDKGIDKGIHLLSSDCLMEEAQKLKLEISKIQEQMTCQAREQETKEREQVAHMKALIATQV